MRKVIGIVVLLSLLMVGLSPLAQAPNFGSPKWDVVYDVRNSYPEDETGWTRDTGGTIARAFQYHDQILNVSLTGAGTDYDRYTREIPESDYLIVEARLSMAVDDGNVLLIFNTSGTVARLAVTDDKISLVITNPKGWTQTNDHYEENIIGTNHTYTLVVYKEDGDTYIQGYYDHNLILQDSIDSEPVYTHFWFEFEELSPVDVNKYCEWDYVAIGTTDLTSKIIDLEDEIDELKREIARLKRDAYDNNPVKIDETTLPSIPSRTKGELDGDVVYVDPYRTTVYDTRSNDTGSSLSFYLPYPSTATDYTILTDDLWIAGSYTRIWVNDTVGSAEILNTTETIGYYNLGDEGYNLTIETSGGDVRADRFTMVRLVDSFQWGNEPNTRIYTAGSTIENEISEDMTTVSIYWAKVPETYIDPRSVEIIDVSTSLVLDAGRHYVVDFSGFKMELSSIGTGTSRSFEIEYENYVEGTDITKPECIVYEYTQANKYGKQYELSQVTCNNNNPFDYDGQIIVKFFLTNSVDLDSVVVEDITGTGYQTQRDYTQLVILGVQFDSFSSKTFNIWFKFSDDTTTERVVQDLIPWFIVLGAIMIVVGLGGWLLTDYGKLAKEAILEKKRMYRLVFGVGAIIEILTAIGTIWN